MPRVVNRHRESLHVSELTTDKYKVISSLKDLPAALQDQHIFLLINVKIDKMYLT